MATETPDVPVSSSDETLEKSLIAVGTKNDTIWSTADIDQLRKDREAHRHNTIWTKDPHGGAYRKVCWTMWCWSTFEFWACIFF